MLSSNVDMKVVGNVDIGANTKCLLFLNDDEDHLYICFNWFDPKSLVDILSLTCRLATGFKLQHDETTEDKESTEIPLDQVGPRTQLTSLSDEPRTSVQLGYRTLALRTREMLKYLCL